MKKRYILFIIFIISIIFIIYIFSIFNNNKQSENKEKLLEQNIDTKKEDDLAEQSIEEKKGETTTEQKIETIKEDLGYNNTNTEMYEIKKEYDGREVITIKPNIQYKVALAGAIKNGKPEFSEIDELLKQFPNKSGIWVTKSSREKFINLLKSATIANYFIDNDGFLIQETGKNSNEIDEKIKRIIESKKIYSIDINKLTYLIDDLTESIEEYPFEEIDPETPFETFEIDNASLYVLTDNTYKRLENKYIIEEMINNMNN